MQMTALSMPNYEEEKRLESHQVRLFLKHEKNRCQKAADNKKLVKSGDRLSLSSTKHPPSLEKKKRQQNESIQKKNQKQKKTKRQHKKRTIQ